MIQSENIDLFKHNIIKYTVDPLSYDKNGILKTITSNYNKQKDRNFFDNMYVASSNLHHSYNDIENKDLPLPDYTSLMPIYESIFKNFYSTLKVRPGNQIKYHFQIVNYTCSNINQFMRRHHHLPTADFSCIHYLQFDDEHSPTLFYNPGDVVAKSYKAMRNNLVEKLDLNDVNSLGYAEYTAPLFKEDDMIVFPAYLEHEIPPSKKEYKRNRITIIANTWIE